MGGSILGLSILLFYLIVTRIRQFRKPYDSDYLTSTNSTSSDDINETNYQNL